jgi:N-acetylmuramoyl-L-alanine amidase
MFSKKYINHFLFWLGIAISSAQATTILIDPGHGGDELGATRIHTIAGKKMKINEKDLSLIYAKEIHKELSRFFSVYLTRSIDRTVSLQERADMADKVKADFVISVHFNAHERGEAEGFETYYLDNHKDAAVKKMENVENKGLKGEDLVVNQILIDLVIKNTVASSKVLAEKIHGRIGANISKKYKFKDRKVQAGLFYLLALAKRPGVLLEVGFISNAKEVEKLLSEKFRIEYAKSVAQAMVEFARIHSK